MREGWQSAGTDPPDDVAPGARAADDAIGDDEAGDDAAGAAGQPWRHRSARGWRGPDGRPGPPWWPAEAPGDYWAWRHRRHGFARRFGCLAAILVLLFVAGLTSLAFHLATAAGARPPGLAGLGALAVVGAGLLLIMTVAVGRGVRGLAVPLDDLVDGAQRVEAGQYGTRVPERPWGPRELRRLARAFNAMTARLETDERQRRTLLADVSHELRTPLSVLQGELEAMVDGVHPSDPGHLAAALDETRVLGRLIDDLRTLALAEAGTLTLHREPTDVGVVLTEVAEGSRLARGAGPGPVELQVADDVPLLEVDPLRLREIVANLVTNALRYSPPGRPVRVTAALASSGREVLISVADEGPGIASELLPHVFDRFAKSAESRGSGLGLAIARQLVEAHGGWISVDSEPARGTTFRLGLPLEPPGR